MVASAAELKGALPQMVGKDPVQLINEHGTTLQSLLKMQSDRRQTPWYVWKYNTSTHQPRYAVFFGQKLLSIPGASSGSILLLSSDGKEIGAWTFSTGWRIDLVSARCSFDDALDGQLITISSAPHFGADVARQYFALVDDKLYFTRMEDSQGRLVQNHYLSPNFTLGGAPPCKDLECWAALLQSPQLPLRLAALTYVSGVHMNPDKPRSEVRSESVEEARIARAFRTAAATKKRIEEYRRSDNPWLKEAADLATLQTEDTQ